MTGRKITYALNKIESCKKGGCMTEALIRTYHLNIHLVKYILEACSEDYSTKDKKVKAVFRHFLDELNENPRLRSILNKRNLKSLKPWLDKMEHFFKALKIQQPSNVNSLQLETEKIFGILNISANKLFSAA